MSGVPRFCSQCGSPRAADALFCENCGRSFARPADGAQAAGGMASMAAPIASAAPVAPPATMPIQPPTPAPIPSPTQAPIPSPTIDAQMLQAAQVAPGAPPPGWQPSSTPPPVAPPTQNWTGAPQGQAWGPPPGAPGSMLGAGPAAQPGWGAPVAGVPRMIAEPDDQVSASIARHLVRGRLTPLLALMTGGILVAAGTVLPWLSMAGAGTANAFDFDTFYGGPLAWVVALLGIAIIAVAATRLLRADLPPGLELIAAAAGLIAVVLAIIRFPNLQENTGPEVSLGIGYFIVWIGALVSIVVGIYPTYRAASIRARHEG